MKNLFKITHGGVSGRNQAHQIKIRKIALTALSLIAVIFAIALFNASMETFISAGAGLAALPLFMIDNKFVELKGVDLEKFKAEATAEELGAYFKALSDHRQEELTKAIENKASKEDVEKLRKMLGEVVVELTQIAAQAKAGREIPGNSNFESGLRKFIADNIEKIKEIKTAKSGAIEFELKAVGNITTASGTNTNPPAITGTQQAPLSNINLRSLTLLNLTTNLNTNLAAYPYTEAKPKDGDYTFLSEGDTKEQIDFSWETNYAKPVKTAAWIRLSDESVEDVAGLQSVAEDFLRKKHDIKKQVSILFGDGISPNPKGATKYGREFVAGDMANKVPQPNFMDVVNAAITDIFTTHNYEDETPYMASLVLINPIDFFLELVSAKDGEGKPLYPTASLFNQVVIGGVTIMPEEKVPAGKIFVADMSKYNTTNYKPYRVVIGWINDDLIKNQFVILGESRFHAFVKKLDEQAFIYDDIAVIKSAIEKV